MMKSEKIHELLTRGVEEVIDLQHLEQALRSGKKLRVKLGIDPTSPNIHVGRAVALWKLREFQELGHKVIFLIGDYTAQVGDTSDKDSERPLLTEAQIKKNMKDYFKQAFLILDKAKTETHYNSEWLQKLGTWEIIKLADLFSLNEFQSREMIRRRVQAGKGISMKEVIYPLMQGYDSVALKADVELGGSDQRYNLLAGRVIQKAYGQEPQDILTMTLLAGTDGRKMSSSWGNVINLIDDADDMYGKIMSIPDGFIEKYFQLATRKPLTEIAKLTRTASPYEQKRALAYEITRLYHGDKPANNAQQKFTKQFSKGELPDNIPTKKILSGTYLVSELLVMTGLASSKSEARRLLKQYGVKVNGKVIQEHLVTIDASKDFVIQVGKRKFLRIK